MNERFKDLASQAGFDVKRLMEPYPGGFPREDILALESFAELIVRECMSMCQARADNPAQGSFRDGALLSLNDIKEHFGVEL